MIARCCTINRFFCFLGNPLSKYKLWHANFMLKSSDLVKDAAVMLFSWLETVAANKTRGNVYMDLERRTHEDHDPTWARYSSQPQAAARPEVLEPIGKLEQIQNGDKSSAFWFHGWPRDQCDASSLFRSVGEPISDGGRVLDRHFTITFQSFFSRVIHLSHSSVTLWWCDVELIVASYGNQEPRTPGLMQPQSIAR